jgi:hypothetical protein
MHGLIVKVPAGQPIKEKLCKARSPSEPFKGQGLIGKRGDDGGAASQRETS